MSDDLSKWDVWAHYVVGADLLACGVSLHGAYKAIKSHKEDPETRGVVEYGMRPCEEVRVHG